MKSNTACEKKNETFTAERETEYFFQKWAHQIIWNLICILRRHIWRVLLKHLAINSNTTFKACPEPSTHFLQKGHVKGEPLPCDGILQGLEILMEGLIGLPLKLALDYQVAGIQFFVIL